MADYSKALDRQVQAAKKYFKLGDKDAVRHAVQLENGKPGLSAAQYIFAPFRQQFYRNQGASKYINPWFLTGEAVGTAWDGIKSGWNKLINADPQDTGTLQGNVAKLIPWASDRGQLKKYLVDESIIDRDTGKISGGKENMGRVKEAYKVWRDAVLKWNASVQEYNKFAIDTPRQYIQPSWKNFLLMHRRDKQNQQLQAAHAASQHARLQPAGGRTGVQQGSQFLGNSAMQSSGVEADAGGLPPGTAYQTGLVQTILQKLSPSKKKKSNIGDQAFKAAKRNQEILKSVPNLPKDHQVAFWSTLATPTVFTAAGAGSPLVRSLAGNDAGYRALDYGSKLMADIHTSNKRQLLNALYTGNLAGLTQQQREHLEQTYHLPAWNQQDPVIKDMWVSAGNRQWEQIKDIYGNYALATYFAGALAPGVASKTKAVQRLAPGIKPQWVKRGITGIADRFTMHAPPDSPIEKRVANGELPKQTLMQVQELLKAQGIPATNQNIIQTIKLIKQMSEPSTAGKSGLVQSIAGWVAPRVIQRTLQDYQGYGALSPEQQEIKRNEIIRSFNDFKGSKFKQEALRTFVSDPKNRQVLRRIFDKYNATQLGNIKDNMQSLSQFISPVISDQIQETQKLLRGIAEQSALTRFRTGLRQKDPNKFQQNMKQWLPLFSRAGGEGNYAQIKDQARKAVWQQVKRNPLFINKALSFWALQNGYSKLHQFLADNGAFYGTVAGLGIGLPLTIALMTSLFSNKDQDEQEQRKKKEAQARRRRYQMAYAPQKNVTDRRLIVGDV